MYNRKVLLIEDDSPARVELTQILERKFKTVFSAQDGSDGFEIYKKELPDLIVTDIKMPKLNGVEFSKLVKSKILHNTYWQYQPIVMLSI